MHNAPRDRPKLKGSRKLSIPRASCNLRQDHKCKQHRLRLKPKPDRRLFPRKASRDTTSLSRLKQSREDQRNHRPRANRRKVSRLKVDRPSRCQHKANKASRARLLSRTTCNNPSVRRASPRPHRLLFLWWPVRPVLPPTRSLSLLLQRRPRLTDTRLSSKRSRSRSRNHRRTTARVPRRRLRHSRRLLPRHQLLSCCQLSPSRPHRTSLRKRHRPTTTPPRWPCSRVCRPLWPRAWHRKTLPHLFSVAHTGCKNATLCWTRKSASLPRHEFSLTRRTTNDRHRQVGSRTQVRIFFWNRFHRYMLPFYLWRKRKNGGRQGALGGQGQTYNLYRVWSAKHASSFFFCMGYDTTESWGKRNGAGVRRHVFGIRRGDERVHLGN